MDAARTSSLALVALACAGLPGFERARAATPDPGADENELDVADAGLLLQGTAGRSASGRYLLGAAGVRTLGLRSAQEGAWLAGWDARLAGVTGYAAMATPAPLMVGWLAQGDGALGWRLAAGTGWSPYLGTHASLDFRSLRPSRGGAANLNQMPGARGLTWDGAVRLEAGASWLEDRRTLRLVAFLQGARRPVDAAPEATFGELGLAARLDVGDRLSASLDASRGLSSPRRDHALAYSDRTTHDQLEAVLHLALWRSAWLELEGRASRNADRIAYAAGRTYRTTSAPALQGGVAIGAWVWR